MTIDCSQPRPAEYGFGQIYWDQQCASFGGTQGAGSTNTTEDTGFAAGTQTSETADPLAELCSQPRPEGPYTFATQTWDRYCAPMQEPVDDTPAGQEAMVAGGYGGAGMGGVFSATPMGLNYAAPQVPQTVAPPPKVDFVKMLNSVLMADVLGGMLTGRKL
jgi:hypothetical protein